jgi:isopenicillin N synthase-like dioxygenase
MSSLEEKKATSIPVIDFLTWTSPFNVTAGDRLETARELVEACHSTGFVYIKNHGVSPEILGEAFAMSKKYFDLPKEKKMLAANAGAQSFRGYSWPGLENGAAISDEGTTVPGSNEGVVEFNVRIIERQQGLELMMI